MKAITIRAPWADAVVDGHKDVENRAAGFPSRYRGTVLVHAARKWSVRGQHDARVRRWYAMPGVATRDRRPPRGFILGAVIGEAEIVDAHEPVGECCRPWGESTYTDSEGSLTRCGVHLVLENARRFPEPVPWRGALGLWTPPPELVEACYRLEEL